MSCGRRSSWLRARMKYTVSVSRLDGTDTRLRALATPGAALSPMFDPDVREYLVHVPSAHDRLGLRWVPWDVGQTFQVTAQPATFEASSWQETTPAPPAFPLPADHMMDGEPDVSAWSRRLGIGDVPAAPPGEAQYAVLTRWFLMEVGGTRLVTIRVRPANGDDSQNGTYTLRASRASCPAARPLFAPDVGICAMTCNEGYFPRASASRCEVCPPHCIHCVAWDDCKVCEASRWRVLHFVWLSGGRCRTLRIPWGRIAGAAVCACVAAALCCCCCCGHASPRSGLSHAKVAPAGPGARVRRRWDEAEGPQSHRLLRTDGEPGEHSDEG